MNSNIIILILLNKQYYRVVTVLINLDVCIFAHFKINCEVMPLRSFPKFKLVMRRHTVGRCCAGPQKARGPRLWPIWPMRKSVTGCKQCKIVPKKQMFDPAASESDTLYEKIFCPTFLNFASYFSKWYNGFLSKFFWHAPIFSRKNLQTTKNFE